ncbi:MAG: Hsp70 family protein, partial [Methylococcaceae bacterium]
IEVKPSYGLGDGDIARMIEASYRHARDDLEARRLQEQRVEAARLVAALEAALAADGQLLNPQESDHLKQGMTQLNDTATTSDWEAIKHACENLNEASIEFAARRMDQSIQKALTGQKLEALEV